MSANKLSGVCAGGGSKSDEVNNTPGPGMNMNNMNMGMGVMQGIGMPMNMNLAQNMGGAFAQGMMGAIPMVNVQQQGGQISQGGQQLPIDGMNNNQQMQGLMAMNNPNMANMNMNGMQLDQLNQVQGQNNQIQLMNLLAQQQQQQRQAGMGNNNHQQQMQTPQAQMPIQPLMANQAQMQATQALMPNQAQLIQQQQHLLQLNLQKRQKELQQGQSNQQLQKGQANSTSTALVWNQNTNVNTNPQVMQVDAQMTAASPVQHLQMAAAQAQAQNMFQDQLQKWQSQQGGNQRRQSSRPPSAAQNIEQHHSGSNASSSCAPQHRPGSAALAGQHQQRPSSNMSMGGMLNNMQQGNQRNSFPNPMQAPLVPNTLFSQSRNMTASSLGQNNQQLHLQNQFNSPGQGNQSRPPSSAAMSTGQFNQHVTASSVTIDPNNQRVNHSQAPVSQQSHSGGSMQLPNQFFSQQPQHVMQNRLNMSRATSNVSAGQSQYAQDQTMRRRSSNNSQGLAGGVPGTMPVPMGLQSPGTQQQPQTGHHISSDSRASFVRRGSNSDSKSGECVDPKLQRRPSQNQQYCTQSNPTNNVEQNTKPRQHQDQQVQAQAWFLFQQPDASPDEGTQPESNTDPNEPKAINLSVQNEALRRMQGHFKLQEVQPDLNSTKQIVPLISQNDGMKQQRASSKDASQKRRTSASNPDDESHQMPSTSHKNNVEDIDRPPSSAAQTMQFINDQNASRDIQLQWQTMQSQVNPAGSANVHDVNHEEQAQNSNTQQPERRISQTQQQAPQDRPQQRPTQMQLTQLEEMQRRYHSQQKLLAQIQQQQGGGHIHQDNQQQHQLKPNERHQQRLLALQQQAHQRALSLNYSLDRQRSTDSERRRPSQPPQSDQQQQRQQQQQRAIQTHHQLQRLMQQRNIGGLTANPDLASAVMNVNGPEHSTNAQGSTKSSSAFSGTSSNKSGIHNFYNPKSKRRPSDNGDKKETPPEQLVHPPVKPEPRSSFEMSSPLTASASNEQRIDTETKNKLSHNDAHEHHHATPQAALTNEEILQMVTKLPAEERLVFSTKHLLGAGKNGFSRVTSSMQRMKRQRARQIGSADGEEPNDEQLCKKTFNGRFAKKLHSDLINGLQYTNMMTEILKSVMLEIDPENPLLSIPLPTVFDPEEPLQHDESSVHERHASAQGAASSGLNTSADPETVAGGNPSGSTLRKRKSQSEKIDLALMETINDDDGKQLPKKEIGYRLFESSRWRTLEQGAPVAAKVNSQELWILSRVAKRWDSPGLTYKQIRDLSEIKKDAIFSEKVFIQDHNEYTGDINNARAIARKNILPLPVSIAEGNKWGLRARKGSRIYALYPNTASLYPGTVINNTMYSRGEDDVIVVEFDDDEDDLGETPNRHVPARYVTLMPKESPAFKRRRKSTTAGGAAKKRKSQATSLPTTGPSTPMTPPHKSSDTSVDRMLLEMLEG